MSSLSDLGLYTEEDVRNYISDGSGQEPKIVRQSDEVVRDINISMYLNCAVRVAMDEYNVSRECVINLAKEL